MALNKIWIIEGDWYDSTVTLVADSPEAARAGIIESHTRYQAENPNRKADYGWEVRWDDLEKISDDKYRLTGHHPAAQGVRYGATRYLITLCDYAKDDPDVR